ncbi:MAG TPA: glutathione S-transferase N-terminal domain-containing protein [Usitatibacter sp.]|jgi:glutathione S-transferase|nr:glutathione S-transferase N-terminal domain-containing protein [Usitatibacter sp.]
MSIKLYFAPGACSLASHIALEESGLDYETQKLDLAAGDQRKPEYLALNPRGRVPTLVVDGHVITENVGILTYVAGGHPEAKLWPKDTLHQAMAVSTMAWLSNTVHPAFGHVFRAERYADGEAAQDAVKAKGRTMFAQHLKEIDELLKGRKWAVGDRFTVVDGYLVVFYRWGNRNQVPVHELKNYSALMDRVLARPAVKKVMADEGITMS